LRKSKIKIISDKSTKKLLYCLYLCLYMAIKSKIKKWGNSYGVLIGKEEMKKKNIHEGETVIITIKKKKELEDIFGICNFNKPTEKIIKEIREGYDE